MDHKTTPTSVYLTLCSFVRGIILFPIRLILMLFAVPNLKIVYSNGHVERIFLREFKKDGDIITWIGDLTCKHIVLLCRDHKDICAVYQLY